MEDLLGFLCLVLMLGFVVLQIKNQGYKQENSKMYKENLSLKHESLGRELRELNERVPTSLREKEHIEEMIQLKKEERSKISKELAEFRQIEQEKTDKYYNGRR